MSCPVRSSFLIILKVISGYTSPQLTVVWPPPPPPDLTQWALPLFQTSKHQSCSHTTPHPLVLQHLMGGVVTTFVTCTHLTDPCFAMDACKCSVAASLDKLECPFSEVTITIVTNHTLLWSSHMVHTLVTQPSLVSAVWQTACSGIHQCHKVPHCVLCTQSLPTCHKVPHCVLCTQSLPTCHALCGLIAATIFNYFQCELLTSFVR